MSQIAEPQRGTSCVILPLCTVGAVTTQYLHLKSSFLMVIFCSCSPFNLNISSSYERFPTTPSTSSLLYFRSLSFFFQICLFLFGADFVLLFGKQTGLNTSHPFFSPPDPPKYQPTQRIKNGNTLIGNPPSLGTLEGDVSFPCPLGPS